MRGAKILATSALAAWSLSSFSAQAGVKFDGANVYVDAEAGVSARGGKPLYKYGQSDDIAKSVNSVLNASINAYAQQGGTAVRTSAYDQENAFAEFTNKLEGDVEFGGTTSLSVGSSLGSAIAFDSGTSFDYDFTLTSAYEFLVNYSYAETDGYYIANRFQLISQAGGAPLFGFNPPDGSFADPQTGSVSYLLGPGSYEFGASTSLGDLTLTGGPATEEGAHAEHYDFTLTSVSAAPEPGTWTLLVAGVALLGIALRVQRKRAGQPGVVSA